ncbi:MAG: hypothetical protein GXY83_37415 [Rhodopirellula sp.]|nr:hypothetical protein [Rhodopirellula sp.]
MAARYLGYLERGLSVDDILTDLDEAAGFARSVNERLPIGERQPSSVILRRLITLRKRGQDRGGLPRSAGDYRGLATRPK